MARGLEEVAERLRRELAQFELGDTELESVFGPLIETCETVAKTENEFLQCVREATETLKLVLKKVK